MNSKFILPLTSGLAFVMSFVGLIGAMGSNRNITFLEAAVFFLAVTVIIMTIRLLTAERRIGELEKAVFKKPDEANDEESFHD